MNSQGKLIGGLVISVIGLIGTIIGMVLISGDWMYTYSPPFTSHEIGRTAIVVISAILLLVGVIMIIAHFAKKK